MSNLELIEMIQKLNDKIDSMQKQDFHFHIANVKIDKLHLDELVYHLDKIDIKELSGMLNLGNAFSPSVESTKSQTKTAKTAKNKKEAFTQEIQKEREITPGSSFGEEYPALSIIINGKEMIFDSQEGDK